MDCTIYVAKTKALISCAVTAQLICAFVFAYTKSRFSHEAAQMLTLYLKDSRKFTVCPSVSGNITCASKLSILKTDLQGEQITTCINLYFLAENFLSLETWRTTFNTQLVHALKRSSLVSFNVQVKYL